MLSLMIIFILLFGIIEGPGLVKRKEEKEIAVVAFLFLVSLTYGMDFVLQLHLMPNPKSLIYNLLPVAEQISAFFNLMQ